MPEVRERKERAGEVVVDVEEDDDEEEDGNSLLLFLLLFLLLLLLLVEVGVAVVAFCLLLFGIVADSR